MKNLSKSVNKINYKQIKLNCVTCGKEFEGIRKHAYCSLQCRPSVKNKVPKIEKECPSCHKSFIYDHWHRTYCSPECSSRRHLFKVPRSNCIKCKKEIIGSDKAKYCSEECRPQPKSYYSCEKCGIKFQNGHTNTLCEIDCKNENRSGLYRIYCYLCNKEVISSHASKTYCDEHEDNQQNAKYRKRNKLKQHLLLQYIEFVHGNKCSYCGLDVDIDLSYGDLMSPTVDHIIALDKGGSNCVNNTRLCHSSCNSKKGKY